MRYKHIIALAMILVSEVCCKGEYWWDERNKCFKSYGPIFGEKSALPGNFIKGVYSFRPIPEDKDSKEPQIVIEFEFIQRTTNVIPTLHDILVKKITFTEGKLDEGLLKTETKEMGKMMVNLFIKGLGENIDHYEMLRMLHRFVFALNAVRPDFIEILPAEFAAGMTEGVREFHLDTGFSNIIHPKLTEDQIKLLIKLTKTTADLVYDTTELDNTATVDTNLSHEQHTVDSVYPEHKASLAKCLRKKQKLEQFTPIEVNLNIKDCKLPFGEYFFNLFMGAMKFEDHVERDNALQNLYVMIKAAVECNTLPEYIYEMTGYIKEILALYKIVKNNPFADLDLSHLDSNSWYNSITYHANNIASYFSK